MRTQSNSPRRFARIVTSAAGPLLPLYGALGFFVCTLLAACFTGETSRLDGEAGAGEAPAEPIEVAVAANFSATLREIVDSFTAETGVPVRISVGATGQLYAQIRNGAPYHLFVAADREYPRLLEEAGLAVPGTRRSYAVGRLALFAPGLAPVPPEPLQLLDRPGIVVAWANPRTAPYGAAARAVMEATGRERLGGARGESVGQVLQFVLTGAADVGLLALAQVRDRPPKEWAEIDPALYPVLRQDAVLLNPGAEAPGARALLDYLVSAPVRDMLRSRGYAPPAWTPPDPDPA